MGAETAGRKLGIGLRLAARAARDQAVKAGDGTPAPTGSGQKSLLNPNAAKAKAKGLAEGTKRFGLAVIGPMAHTGGVLWLEITGIFFGLFAAFFAQNVYRLRSAYKAGPDHLHFLTYSGLTLLFLAFMLMNFWKARRKEKRNRARRMAAATKS
jgi:hypothetical protein